MLLLLLYESNHSYGKEGGKKFTENSKLPLLLLYESQQPPYFSFLAIQISHYLSGEAQHIDRSKIPTRADEIIVLYDTKRCMCVAAVYILLLLHMDDSVLYECAAAQIKLCVYVVVAAAVCIQQHVNKKRVVCPGVVKPLVELVVAAGEVNKEQCTVGMAEKAMVVLSSLAAVEEGKVAIVDEGGVQALVEVIEDGASVKEKEFAVTVTARAKHKAETLLWYVHKFVDDVSRKKLATLFDNWNVNMHYIRVVNVKTMDMSAANLLWSR
ncbi:hypothetical protein QVD17_19712 [Tagetes erecta]|uniref:Uncharacterized protein n=1 Tax=Tagetes erecta TaxID=13708 RepID=A0AAD8NWQ0_TARER|nr:hypothetical protein QVD17_19712 [Tagetes erecta]